MYFHFQEFGVCFGKRHTDLETSDCCWSCSCTLQHTSLVVSFTLPILVNRAAILSLRRKPAARRFSMWPRQASPPSPAVTLIRIVSCGTQGQWGLILNTDSIINTLWSTLYDQHSMINTLWSTLHDQYTKSRSNYLLTIYWLYDQCSITLYSLTMNNTHIILNALLD